MPKTNEGGKKWRKWILVAGLGLIAAGNLLAVSQTWGEERFGVIDRSILIEVPEGALDAGALGVTQKRLDYRRGDMSLIIPSLGLSTTIGESTRPEILKQSPGLYEFSGVPGMGDVNVSIAAHRDIYGMEFYSLDKLAGGDFLYLIYEGTVFRYLYLDTQIIKPDRWDVIRPQGFSCLTLTTCDPIGTTWNRLIVRAELADITPYGVENDFAANADSGSS